MTDDPILSAGEWEALLYGTDGDLRRLVARLALRHGQSEAVAAG